MSTGMSIVLKLITTLGALSALMAMIGFILWIVSVIQKDSAYIAYMGQQKRTRAIRVRIKDKKSSSDEDEEEETSDDPSQVKDLVTRMEIETDVFEEEYSLRKQRVQKYRMVWLVALVLSCVFFYITVILKEDIVNQTYGYTQQQTSSQAPSPTQAPKQTFQLPDGTIVGADDVYIGADGQYYLKPGVDPYGTDGGITE